VIGIASIPPVGKRGGESEAHMGDVTLGEILVALKEGIGAPHEEREKLAFDAVWRILCEHGAKRGEGRFESTDTRKLAADVAGLVSELLASGLTKGDLPGVYAAITQAIDSAKKRGACAGCGRAPEWTLHQVTRVEPSGDFYAQAGYDHADWYEVRSHEGRAYIAYGGTHRVYCPACGEKFGLSKLFQMKRLP
jgi:hypothetical protein